MTCDWSGPNSDGEEVPMVSAREQAPRFTHADYLTWPIGERWELIDGQAYNLSQAPSYDYQRAGSKLHALIYRQLEKAGSTCETIRSIIDPIPSRRARTSLASPARHGCRGLGAGCLSHGLGGLRAGLSADSTEYRDHDRLSHRGWLSICRSQSPGQAKPMSLLPGR